MKKKSYIQEICLNKTQQKQTIQTGSKSRINKMHMNINEQFKVNRTQIICTAELDK